MDKLTATLKLTKTTSNWYVYSDRKSDITPVYVNKDAVKGEPDEEITVTVEASKPAKK